MSSDETNKENLKKGRNLVILVLSVLYTAVNQLFTGLNISTELSTDDMNVGLFVTATGALIFGRGAAGAAAGLGEILVEVQKMLAGEGSTIHLGTLLAASSLAIGTWLTGFLGRDEQTLPKTFSGIVFSKGQVKKLGIDTIAAIIGTSLTSNFLYVFGSQIQEGASLEGGVPIFLSRFLEDAVVIILFVPITLIMFDMVQLFNKKRDAILEALLRKIDTKVQVDKAGIENLSVSLPQRSLTVGLWSPIVLKFKNKRDTPTTYIMEAVSTSKLYPHKDHSTKLEPGETWTQTFFALPSKQSSVNIRMRIIPDVKRKFKEAIKEETIVEFEASTRSQSGIVSSLIGFSGVNGALLGGAMVWDKLVDFISDYQSFVDQLKDASQVLFAAAIAEVMIFGSVLTGMWYSQKRKIAKAPLKLSFSNDIEDQSYTEIIESKLEQYIDRYKSKLAPLSRFIVYIAAIVTVVILGKDGYFILTDPSYTPENPEYILYSIVALLVSWIFGMRGIEFLHEIGILKKSPYNFKKGSVITKFQPLGQFQEGIPTEVIVVAKNPSDKNGIRIKLEGFDTISPDIVELHIAPNETSQFKIAVTPLRKERQDILALVYPLFDEDGEYVDFYEAEPFERQEVSYDVVGQTSLGITKQQSETLKKFGGLGGMIAGALLLVNEYVNIPNFEDIVKESAPYLAALQAPFVYAYFSISNRLKTKTN